MSEFKRRGDYDLEPGDGVPLFTGVTYYWSPEAHTSAA